MTLSSRALKAKRQSASRRLLQSVDNEIEHSRTAAAEAPVLAGGAAKVPTKTIDHIAHCKPSGRKLNAARIKLQA